MPLTPEQIETLDRFYGNTPAAPKSSGKSKTDHGTFGYMTPFMEDVQRGATRGGLGIIDLAADYAPETVASLFGATPEKFQTAMDSAIDKNRQASEKRPVLARLPGEMLGDPLLAVRPLKMAYGLGHAVMGAGQGVLQPTKADESRGANALMGGIVGYGAGNALDLLGKGVQAGTNAILPKSNPDVIAGALDAGLPVTGGQAYGGEALPRLEAHLRQAPIGGAVLRTKGEQLADATQGLLDEATTTNVTAGAAARALRSGGKHAASEIQQHISAPYDDLLKTLPTDRGIPTPQARAALDQARQEFQYNPKALDILNDELFNTVTSGNVPGGVLKQQLRKQIEAIANSSSARDLGLTDSLRSISSGINSDVRTAIERGFDDVPGIEGAATAYRNADRRYGAGKRVIEDILGFTDNPNVADEQLINQYLRMGNRATTKSARGADAQLFNTIKNRLPKAALDKLESYRLSQLGKNELGDFEAGRAVREFQGLTPEAQKFALLNLSPEKRKAWRSAVDYISNIKGTLNPSGSAAGVSETVGFKGLAMGPINWLASHMLASDKVARGINKLPREVLTNPISPRTQQMIVRALVSQGLGRDEAQAIANPPQEKTTQPIPPGGRSISPEDIEFLDRYFEMNGGAPAAPSPAPATQEQPISNSQQPPGAIAPAIQKAATISGIDPGILTRIVSAESAFDPNAKNPNSSAEGLFQITNKTWRTQVKRYGKEYGITYQDRKNPEANAIMGALLARDNKARLAKRLNYEPDGGDLYIAHFLGDYAASKLIKNKDSKNAAAALFPDAARSNRSLFYHNSGRGKPRTAGELYALLRSRFTGVQSEA